MCGRSGLANPHRLNAAGAFDAVLPDVVSDDAQALLAPYAPDAMRAYPVSTAVNDPRHDAPDVLVPLEPPAGTTSTVDAE